MKNLQFLLIATGFILCFPLESISQWSINGSNIYFNKGNVGIGTDNPETQLEIEGKGNQTLRIHSTGFGADDPGIELLRGGQYDGTDWKIVNEGGRLRIKSVLNNFMTNGNTYFQFGATGNASFYSSNSNHTVQVTGNGNQILRLHARGFGADDGVIELLRGGQYDGTDYKLTNDGGVFKILTAINNFTDDGTEAMRVTSSGNVYFEQNVGIGTTNLENYELSVNGQIKCKEVKVTNLNWSDFVFSSDYELMNLEELEEFIEQNNHLPEIPNATEVLTEGTNLGEIDALLLQKIEELTLYIIQLNKENKRLRKMISESER